MLVLTRRPGEQIVIGNGIRVTVVSVGPGRVKIGIDAPPDVRIDRSEIHEKILHEQGSDVLAEVARGPQADDATPTIVSSADTDLKLHNRIADKLPAPAVEASVTAAAADTPAGPMARFRANRKPR